MILVSFEGIVLAIFVLSGRLLVGHNISVQYDK